MDHVLINVRTVAKTAFGQASRVKQTTLSRSICMEKKGGRVTPTCISISERIMF